MIASKLLLCCAEDNDLYRVLTNCGAKPKRFGSLAAAVKAAPKGAGVLALADEYPKPAPGVSERLLTAAARKGLRLYIEYPESTPGVTLSAPRPTDRERLVVASDFFAPRLAAGAVLAQHGCWFLPVNVDGAHLVVARVAGYRRAVYGLPAEAFPALFALPGRPGVLVAATKLSQFVTGRYAPAADWKALWERILGWLLPGGRAPKLRWRPAVAPSFGPTERLPRDAEAAAFRRAMCWFRNEAVYGFDEKLGAIEGYSSGIDHLGRQLRRIWPRNDCIGETAMAFAWDWAVSGNPGSRRTAGKMLDYILSPGDFYQSDPKSPAYGLVNWYDRGPVFYGDDNARSLFGALAAARLCGESRWDAAILRCVLANFRTTGRLGFRHNRLDLKDLIAEGWPHFFEKETVSIAPHYQGYLWAAFLWAYALTGYRPLLERTRTAVRLTMEAYPGKWRWANGFPQEQARMLLPLAWLVRVEDRPEHRGWLARVTGDLLAEMQPCGAIREKMGPLATGRYPSARSNQEYGTREAALIQEDGDPACDLLYTMNFALLGLHEAAAATGEKSYARAADRLVRFLCRIQVHSESHPELDGAWLRGFDYELWEHFGNSADVSWGTWCAETGWTNAWIVAVLAMRARGAALFDASEPLAGRFRALAPGLITEMGLPSQ
jgi:hypothetical protein